MAYTVFVKVGKAQTKSTVLGSKIEVERWIQHSPFGNSRTNFYVTDLFSNETKKVKKHGRF